MLQANKIDSIIIIITDASLKTNIMTKCVCFGSSVVLIDKLMIFMLMSAKYWQFRAVISNVSNLERFFYIFRI